MRGSKLTAYMQLPKLERQFKPLLPRIKHAGYSATVLVVCTRVSRACSGALFSGVVTGPCRMGHYIRKTRGNETCSPDPMSVRVHDGYQ